MDLLSNIFLGCFIFGLVFTVASFLLGGIGHLSGLDANIGGHGPGGNIGAIHGGHGHASAASDSGHGSHEMGGLGWLNFNALIVFITWFGGAGFILNSLGIDAWISFGLAIIGGVIGYFAIMLFMQKVLYSSQTPYLRESDYNLTGTVARVSSPILSSGMGEIIYTKFGTRRSAPARSLDGRTFPKELQVVILRYENGVAYVEDLDKMLAEAGGEKWLTGHDLSDENKQI